MASATSKKFRDRITLGCSGLAGLYTSIGDEEATRIIEYALNLGITCFDTAPHYGMGLSETRIGAYSHKIPSIITKVGRIVVPLSEALLSTRIDQGNIPGSTSVFPESIVNACIFDYTRQGFQTSYDDSCRRLKTSQLFGIRVHDCESDLHVNELLDPDTGGIQLLREWRTSGAVQDISLGMNDPHFTMKILQASPPHTFDSILIAGSWNLLDQSALPLLNECRRRNIKVHNAGVFCSGLLVGGSHYKYSDCSESSSVLTQLAQWKELCSKHQVTIPVAAIAFAFGSLALDSVVFGVSKVSELEQIVQWCDEANHVSCCGLWRDACSQGLITVDVLDTLLAVYSIE
jgi:D-threo-aldose 1-dehydrogenase